MRVVILLHARTTSTRLPKKVLTVIEGKLLIEHVIDRLKLAALPDFIVLCTTANDEDKVLVEIAKKNRIKWFAGNEDDVLDRLIKAAEKEKADIVVRASGEDPLTDPVYIDKAIEHHIKTNADYTKVEGLPKGVQTEIISLTALKKAHTLAANPNMSEYMTLYFTTPSFFHVEILKAGEDVRRPNYRLTVDYPEDLILMKEIFKRLYKPGKIFSLKEVIKLLDENPELAEINLNIKQKKVKSEMKKGSPKIKIVVCE